jgi:hypothetical protein
VHVNDAGGVVIVTVVADRYLVEELVKVFHANPEDAIIL